MCRYPNYKLAFTGLLVLDISSHWFQMKQAGEGEHHKKGNKNFIVKVRVQVVPRSFSTTPAGANPTRDVAGVCNANAW